MTALEIFRYADRDVRTVLIDGEPWFVIADVCRVLDLTNPSMVAATLDPDALSTAEVTDSLGRTQVVRVASEPGVYELVFQSRKSEAKTFKRWLTREVIPQLRRTGSYSVQPQFDVPKTYAAALRLAADETERAERAERQIAADAPKVEAFDNLMDADGYYDFLSAGKILGVGRTTLFRRLREIGVLIPKTRMPYERYAHHFKVTVSTWTDPDGFIHKTETTRIRPSGLPFLAKKLDASGEQLRVIAGGAS